MSIYENYKISVENDKLLYTSNDTIKIFEFSGNSNTSFVKFFSPEYNFINSNYGFSYDDIDKKITYRSLSNVFNSDVFIVKYHNTLSIIDVDKIINKILLYYRCNKTIFILIAQSF